MTPGALGRLIPPWEPIRLLSKTSPGVELNSEVELSVPLAPPPFESGPFEKLGRTVWHAKHIELSPPNSFTDLQLSGPFKRWNHQHLFREMENGTSQLRDCIDFELPFHPVSTLFANWFVKMKLERTFRFRHARTENDLARLNTIKRSHDTVLITGASGLVGRNLKAFLETAGYTVLTLTRGETSGENEYHWDIHKKSFPLEALERADAVVHLAGENIAAGRWTDEQKQRIRQSRIAGTELLVAALSQVSDRPEVFISASATGFYGSRGDEELTEDADEGDLFVSKVAIEWEQETFKATELGIRTVVPRIGVVITPEDGALKKMLLPFLFGVGGPVGSGAQWMSCIAIDDLVYALQFLLEEKSAVGVYNLTSPEPLTNKQFTKALVRTIRRPTLIPAPPFALRAAFGEMADELLLASTRVLPKRLLEQGFTFTFPDIESSLAFSLGAKVA